MVRSYEILYVILDQRLMFIVQFTLELFGCLYLLIMRFLFILNEIQFIELWIYVLCFMVSSIYLSLEDNVNSLLLIPKNLTGLVKGFPSKDLFFIFVWETFLKKNTTTSIMQLLHDHRCFTTNTSMPILLTQLQISMLCSIVLNINAELNKASFNSVFIVGSMNSSKNNKVHTIILHDSVLS